MGGNIVIFFPPSAKFGDLIFYLLYLRFPIMPRSLLRPRVGHVRVDKGTPVCDQSAAITQKCRLPNTLVAGKCVTLKPKYQGDALLPVTTWCA